jgi:hypothetical protein
MKLHPFIALVAVVALTGCASLEKQRAIDAIADAARAPEIRVGTIEVSTQLTKGPGGVAAGLPTGAPAAVPVRLQVVVDVAHDRAALLAPPAAAARIGATEAVGFPPLVIFDDGRVYVRAPDSDLVGARPWLAGRVDEISGVVKATTDDLRRPLTDGELLVVSPLDVMHLALGFLSGSVKASPENGATVYRGRTSIDKATRERDLDPDDADPFRDILKRFAAKDDVNPITVVLGRNRKLQSIAVAFTGRPEYGIRFATTFSLALEPATPGMTVDRSVFTLPKPADVVEVSSLTDLRAAVDQWAALGGAA